MGHHLEIRSKGRKKKRGEGRDGDKKESARAFSDHWPVYDEEESGNTREGLIERKDGSAMSLPQGVLRARAKPK